jgi:hypothetical protein
MTGSIPTSAAPATRMWSLTASTLPLPLRPGSGPWCGTALQHLPALPGCLRLGFLRCRGIDSLRAKSYWGMAFDGRFIYFAPSKSRIAPYAHGKVLRYDTYSPFKSASYWAAYDAEAIDGLVCCRYRGAVFDSRFVYLCAIQERRRVGLSCPLPALLYLGTFQGPLLLASTR